MKLLTGNMGKSRKKWNYILVFILFAVFVSLTDTPLNILLSYIISFYFLLSLIYSLGTKIPLKEVVLFIMSVQLLLSPALDYEILGKYTYFHMKITEDRYYAFMLPAFVAFWIGLIFPLGRRKFNDAELVYLVKNYGASNRQLGMIFIIIGFIFTFSNTFLNIQSLAFVFTLLSLLLYVGLLYIWLSDSKQKKPIFIISFLLILFQTLSHAIFINFIIICLLFFCFYGLLNKINVVKSGFVIALGVVFLFFLQSVKKDYRRAVWFKGTEENKLFFLANLIGKKTTSLNWKEFLRNSAEVNQRINQGWVMSQIMITIPAKKPFLNGSVFYEELAGIFMARIFVANKATVQSSEKFEKFSGYKLKNYTMAVGIPGDGYGNFGPVNGVFFCFCVALFFNLSIRIFYKICDRHPNLLLWCPLIFFYLMRAGDDFYIIANWIVKSSVFVYIIFVLTKKYNYRIVTS